MFEIVRTRRTVRLSRFKYSAEARRSTRLHVATLPLDITGFPLGAETWSQDERDQVKTQILEPNVARLRAFPRLVIIADASLTELVGGGLVEPARVEVLEALATLRVLVRALEKRGAR